MIIKITTLEELYNLAKKFANCLSGNELILLSGDLSAGKTTFVKAIVSSIDKTLEDEVNSPTFTIMNVYETHKFTIYHIDLYRIKEFDISDIVGKGVIFVEWANLQDFSNYKDLPIVKVNIEIKDNEDRIFRFEADKDLENCMNNI